MQASSRGSSRSHRPRRTMLATMLATVLVAAVGATTTTTTAAEAAGAIADAAADAPPAIVDATGLAFASIEAFCSYHCKPTHVARAFRRGLGVSECDERVCAADAWVRGPDAARRRLHSAANGSTSNSSSSSDDKSVTRVNFMSCQTVAQSATTLAFELNLQQPTTSVFAGFHEAFYEAFDAMVTSANATYDACQLEFLQQKLLPTVDETSADALAASFTNSVQSVDARKPMLVKLQRAAADERACVEAIQHVWSSADEAMTPLLSRQDQSGASATVMLVHVNAAIAAQLNALACVASVTEMPPVLKLMPFARSASQLSLRATTEAPALEIRLAHGSEQLKVLARLQTRLQTLHGVSNAFELPTDAAQRPRVLYTKALGNVETWAHAVALALTDADVLWVDAKAEATQFTIRGSVYGQAMGASEPNAHRRLDDYAASLVGVDGAKNQGIQGTDVVVGITDSGLYIDHDQFDQTSRAMYNAVDKTARKVVFYNAWMNRYDESADLTCGHGTHVAGILAGSSFSGKSRNFGIADAAKIAFMDIGTQPSACAGQSGCAVQLATPADAADLLKSQIDVGARIFSFSWGTLGSDYSAQARDLDLFIYNNPDVLVVVAAGNSGEASATGQRTISSPSGAKNVISVGASLNAAASFKTLTCPEIFNERSVASFSSAGPTTDGRLKPDVVAPGMIITSSKSERPGATTKSSDTCDLQGTSQATPVVTGLAVLLFEWLRDGWWKTGQKNAAFGMSKIPAALLKALIIHSGDPLQKRLAPFESGAISCAGIEKRAWSVAYPDVYQGYGKPNMSNIAEFGTALGAPTLYFLPNSTAGSEPSVAHGKDVKISFTVPRGVDLRATLVWTDPPGSLGAATILQHDLDLTVQIRNGSKKFVPLTASNSTGRDEKNNVEMVQVSYSQLLEAAKNDPNSASLVGADGEIIVEAVIFGRSVLVAKTQAFAFVASSSGIGTAIGSSLSDPTSALKSIWTPWTIGAICVGALVLLIVIALIVRCRTRRNRRAPAAGSYPGGGGGGGGGNSSRAPASRGTTTQQSYYAHTTPAGGLHHAGGARSGGCPYCPFVNADPVVMVNHVENMHGGGGAVPVMEGNFGMPVLSASPMPPSELAAQHHQSQQQYMARYSAAQHHVRRIPDDERCPHCNFSSADPVILVNHVEHMHGQ